MSQPEAVSTPQPCLLERTASAVMSAVTVALMLGCVVALMAAVGP
jgi:hypothetical protein